MMLIIFRIENYDVIEIIAHCENFAIQVAIYSVFFVSVFQIPFIISHNFCIIKRFYGNFFCKAGAVLIMVQRRKRFDIFVIFNK